MTLRRHDAGELRRFLEAVDGELESPVTIVLIGGSALAIGYGVSAATSDIDTYESPIALLEDAAARARAVTGLDIPLGNSTVAQLPADYERRLTRVLPALTTLTAYVVDRYDLAVSKLLRGNEHDRQQLRQLHEAVGLDRDVLVARFRDLIEDYVGDPTEPRWALFHLVESLWGEVAALDVRP